LDLIEMDSKDQNLDLTQHNESISVHFNPFLFVRYKST